MSYDPERLCRWLLGGVFIAAICIGVPHRRRADRAGGPVPRSVDPRWFWAMMGVVAPVLALACVGFLISPRWVEFGRVNMPSWVRLMGAPIAALGLLLFAWMFRHLGLN